MEIEGYETFFLDPDDNEIIGAREGVWSIPLRIGMVFTIHGHNSPYKVVDWNFHIGHPDEKGGLRIILDKI